MQRHVRMPFWRAISRVAVLAQHNTLKTSTLLFHQAYMQQVLPPAAAAGAVHACCCSINGPTPRPVQLL